MLDGGTLQPEDDIEDIIDRHGYYSWENFSENLLKRTYGGAIRDTGQATIDFANYLSNKFFDKKPFPSPREGGLDHEGNPENFVGKPVDQNDERIR